MLNQINAAAAYLKEKIPFPPEIAIVLGTGLNDLRELLHEHVEISYKDIPGFPVSTAPGHKGNLLIGSMFDKRVAVMIGRVHYYEGYSLQEVTFPIRVLQKLGVKNLILTNAAGSLNMAFQPGEIVMLTDHINMMGSNPLIGRNYDELGERFPSLHNTYDKDWRERVANSASENGIPLRSGVYAAVSGPSMETQAECKMLASLGADVVGMSTVPEAIVAIHAGMKVLGLSIVTNMSNIFHSKSHTQQEIHQTALQAQEKLYDLLLNVIKTM
jgi:purine-nucleoside phosphorylase